MTQNNQSTAVVTGKCRLSYEHLMEPHANQPGQESKFSGTFLIPKSDVQTKANLDRAAQAAIAVGLKSKWGGVQPPRLDIAVHDGDGVKPSSGEPYGEECKGCWVVNASSKQKQDIVDINGQPILSASDVYSGMYVRVYLNLFPYNSNGKRGIGVGLGPVQKLEDGEPLGGHVSAASAFGTPADQAPATPAQPATMPQYPVYQAQAPAAQQAPWNAPATGAFDPITGMPIA